MLCDFFRSHQPIWMASSSKKGSSESPLAKHLLQKIWLLVQSPDSKVHGANMGPTWVLSAPDGPHFGPMNLAIRVITVLADGMRYITGPQHLKS